MGKVPDSPTQDLNGVDTPASTGTTEGLTVGGYVFGTATIADHDWYSVTLIAGEGAPIPLDELDTHMPEGVEVEAHEGGQPSWWWLLAAQ